MDAKNSTTDAQNSTTDAQNSTTDAQNSTTDAQGKLDGAHQLGGIQAEQAFMLRICAAVYREGCGLMKEIFDTGMKDEKDKPGDEKFDLMIHIKKRNDWSKSAWKKQLNTTIRKQIEDDKTMKVFDVSTWYAILRYGCNGLAKYKSKLWQEEGTLENHLKKIKEFRNKLMHSSFTLSEIEFEQKMTYLRELLEDTATLMSMKFGVGDNKLRNIVARIRDTLQNIKESPLIDIESYDATPLFQFRQMILKREAIDYLRKAFKKPKWMHPPAALMRQDIPVEAAQMYTPLKIVGDAKKRSHDENDQSDRTVPFYKMLKVAHEKEKCMILINGVAGVGKTTLVQKILCDWETNLKTFVAEDRDDVDCSGKGSITKQQDCNMKNSTSKQHSDTGKDIKTKESDDPEFADKYFVLEELDMYQYIIPIQCRYKGYNSLFSIVEAMLPMAKNYFRSERDMLDCLLDAGTMFILDGIDTITSSFGNILMELISIVKKNRKAMLLCTAQSENLRDMCRVISDHASCLHFQMDGIPEEHRVDYIAKYHARLFDCGVTSQFNADGLLTRLRTTGGLHQQHFWNIPLNLKIVTLLWEIEHVCVDSINSLYELLLESHDMSIEALKRRLLCKNKYSDEEELNKNIKEIVMLIGERALIGIRDSTRLIPQDYIEKIENCCSAYNLPSEELLRICLIKKRSWLPPSDAVLPIYTFRDKPTQEFYAAAYIFNHVFQDGTQNVLKEGEDEFTFTEVYDYLKGMGASNETLQGVKDLEAQKFDEGVNVTNVLKQVTNDTTADIPMSTYKGILILILGFTYLRKRWIDHENVREFVKLMEDAGVVELGQWKMILDTVKCSPWIARTLISKFPDLLVDHELEISDDNAYHFASLLQRSTLIKKVYIKCRPTDLPRMYDLCDRMNEERGVIKVLWFEYLFRHPGSDQKFLVEIYKLLMNCRVAHSFMGQLPIDGNLVANIGGRQKGHVYASLATLKCAKAFNLNVEQREDKGRPFGLLALNLGHIPIDWLKKIPTRLIHPDTLYYLFIPDIENELNGPDKCLPVKRAADALALLEPLHKLDIPDECGFRRPVPKPSYLTRVYFPRFAASASHSKLQTFETITKLLTGFSGLDVRITRCLVFPSRCRPESKEDDAKLQRLCREVVRCAEGIEWGVPYVENKGWVFDMDTWEEEPPEIHTGWKKRAKETEAQSIGL